MTALEIEIRDNQVVEALNRLAATGRDMTPAMRAISLALLSKTQANFAAQAGPGGPWPALAKATQKDRARRGKWPGQMLRDSGRLAASVTPFSNAGEAGIGSNAVYAAIHHLGGDIERAAHSSWVRLRQVNGRPVFAKDSHKRAKTVRYTAGGYATHIPPRPYLPATAAGLQDGMGAAILDILRKHLAGAAKG